jgi:hypothetical protein
VRVLTRRGVVVSCVAAALVLASCERDRKPQGSGPFTADERALFQYLPAGSPLVFGGDYMKLQDLLKGSMGQIASSLDKTGPGLSTWAACHIEMAEHRMKLAAALDLAGGLVAVRTVSSGVTLDDLAGCAQKANFKLTFDADHKFLAIEVPMPAATMGYLALPTGVIYSREAMATSGTPKMTSATRADLEADIAAVGKSSAADDPRLVPLVANIDRRKTMWLVGRGDGTPLADKIDIAWGTFDLTGGLAVDLTAQLKSESAAQKIEQGFARVREGSSKMPAATKDVLKSIKLVRAGSELHATATIDDATLKAAMSQLGEMSGSH